MNHWEGVSEKQKEALIATFEDIIKKGIYGLEVRLIDGEKISVKDNYTTNLKPVAKLLIEVYSKNGIAGGYSYYVGQHVDDFKISHIVLKQQ